MSIGEEERAKVRTSSVSEMGSLLLRGYCMLSEACNECMVPLMRNPQGTEDVCVTCGKVIPVVDDAEGFRGDKEVAGVEKQDDNVDVGTTLDDTRRDGEHTTRDGVYRAGEENGCKDDGSVQSERDVSGLLADRMMRGWALLSEHCPRCDTPLVRRKKSSDTVNDEDQMFCVGCALPVMKESNLNNRDIGKNGNGVGERVKEMKPCNVAQRQRNTVESNVRTCVEETSANVAKCMSRLSMKLEEASNAELKGILDSIQSCAVILRELQQGVA